MRIQLQDSSGAYLVGFAKNKLKSLMSQRIDLNEPVMERFYETNGFRVHCHAERDNDFVHITGGGFRGVLCHPRTIGGNGWNSKGEELPHGPYDFPLIDSDQGTKGLVSRNGALKAVLNPPENYGNLYWSDGDKSKPDILSWKGTPTRHFRLPNDTNVSGLSILETATPGTVATYFEDIPIYTAFGTWLYKGGKQYKQAPKWSWPYDGSGVGGRCLILGACKNSSDKKIYIVTQSDHYSAPATAKLGDTHYALTGPGIYLTLWKSGTQIEGWDLVQEHLYPRNGLPWFGNSSGTEFVCSNGDTLTITGLLTLKQNAYGTYNVSDDVRPTFSNTFTDNKYHEFVGDDPVCSIVNLSFSASTVGESVASTFQLRSETVPVVVPPGSETIPEGSPYVDGPEEYTGNLDDYTMHNSKLQSAVFTKTPPSETCGMGTVLIEGYCISASGGTYSESASMQVRMPVGVWVLATDTTYGDTSASQIFSDISGSIKTVEYIDHGCNRLGVNQYNYACLWASYIPGCINNAGYLVSVAHGPYPEPTVPYTPYGECTPFGPKTIYICNPHLGVPCPPRGSGGYTEFTYTVNNTYMANVMRRLTYTWECP